MIIFKGLLKTNKTTKRQKLHLSKRIFSILFIFVVSLSLPSFSASSATVDPGYWFDVQSLPAGDLGLTDISGLGYMPDAGAFFTLDAGTNQFAVFTMRGELQSADSLSSAVANPLNLAYNPLGMNVYTLDESQGLLEVGTKSDGGTLQFSQQSTSLQGTVSGVANPQGLAFNPDNGNLYVLDADTNSIVQFTLFTGTRLSPESQTMVESVDSVSVSSLDQLNVEGLAYNSEDSSYYVYSPDTNTVYALSESGSMDSSYDLTALNIDNFSGMTFAPSSDSTDDSSKMNLFVADSGTATQDAQVIEVDIAAKVLPQEVLDAALPNVLVQTIDSYLWSPPNTDATGLEYLIADDRLLVADADIEEEGPTSFYDYVNVWESSKTGTVLATCDTTTAYEEASPAPSPGVSNEPAGVAADPVSGLRFFADDNQQLIFIYDLGADGDYCTSDDSTTSFDTTAFGSGDPEGIAYGEGKLFISDGINAQIYVTDLSGTLLNDWDTSNLFDGSGLSDPEGIGYHWVRGTLFSVSRGQQVIAETTIDGTLLNTYDFT
ncbi:MAG: SdiA-regulated domain-containing protein, partial [Anaerolineales bacterium]